MKRLSIPATRGEYGHPHFGSAQVDVNVHEHYLLLRTTNSDDPSETVNIIISATQYAQLVRRVGAPDLPRLMLDDEPVN